MKMPGSQLSNQIEKSNFLKGWTTDFKDWLVGNELSAVNVVVVVVVVDPVDVAAVAGRSKIRWDLGGDQSIRDFLSKPFILERRENSQADYLEFLELA